MVCLVAFASPRVLAQDQEAPVGPFAIGELQVETYQVGCIDVKSCVEILAMLGYNTKAPSGQVELAQLPAVFSLPLAAPKELVGLSSIDEKRTPDKVSLVEETLSAPQNRLMILYHASQSEAVGRLKDLLQRTVDVADRQVLIEGMVIELTEDNLRDLGTQWQKLLGDDWLISFKPDGDKMPFVATYNPEASATAALTDRLRATIRAVVQEGRAEILSSPSVLVLNNRNARIKVVRDTPIVSTKITRDVQNVDVRFEPVGIVLNIKPRVSQDDSAVTMQIIAEVSEVPEGKAIVVEGTEIAPVIDRRIVETVARVHDNTPFIIGGLIRNQTARAEDRVPVLGRVPFVGALFRRRVTTTGRKEVIIVLTPRVVTTGGSHRAVMPKDSSQFDFLGNRLFRNTYRIKPEDLFDLSFLEQNEAILTAFENAQRLVRRHPDYAGRSPFREMAARVIPGEDAVVIRMLYEILSSDRLAFHRDIPTDKLIVFLRDQEHTAGFRIGWLEREGRGILERASPDGTVAGFFSRPYPKDVLFLRFQAASGDIRTAMQHPVADLEWLPVQTSDPSEAEAMIERRLLELNGITDDYGPAGYALVLNTPRDLIRLKTAIAVREASEVNNFEDLLVLRNFRVGRRFGLPEFDVAHSRVFLIDPPVADYFFKSDYYYSALQTRLELACRLLGEALEREGLR